MGVPLALGQIGALKELMHIRIPLGVALQTNQTAFSDRGADSIQNTASMAR